LRQHPQLAEVFCFFFSKKKRLLAFASSACAVFFDNTILGRGLFSAGEAWMPAFAGRGIVVV
jgi:hypothetical protein